MKITSCAFLCAALRPEDEPRARGPAVIFVGRSNVGKSSVINALLGKKGLARTSSTPGRTQSVNFYRINDELWFVDLPGYGYAAAPERVRSTWPSIVEGFLDRWRHRIALAVLVTDARHEPTELDEIMRDWLAAGVPFVVAANKADSLSGNARAAAHRALDLWSRPSEGMRGAFLVSARTGLGVRELFGEIAPAVVKAGRETKGTRWISAH